MQRGLLCSRAFQYTDGTARSAMRSPDKPSTLRRWPEPRFESTSIGVVTAALNQLDHQFPHAGSDCSPVAAVEYMKRNARQGDAEDVLRAIDEHCWKEQPGMMNVGDEKGKILDKIFSDCNPAVALELGSFIGYSAVRMARLLPRDGRLYSIETNPAHTKMAQEVVNYAGVGDKVTFINDSASNIVPRLCDTYGIETIDFVFVDHWKKYYKPDVILLLETGLFRKGTVVLADNAIYPGCPDYLEFIRSHPKFTSEAFDSHLEYSDKKDSMEMSVYLGE